MNNQASVQDWEKDMPVMNTKELKALLRLDDLSKEDFVSGFPFNHPEDQVFCIAALKKNTAMYDAVGNPLENWTKLPYASKMSVLRTVYDIVMND